ncbi:chemotaxis protein CheC [Arenibaculum sp.]|jgi:chemotaxis protein CheC|uniref:chemotaxis protein CheC n=1 Tax=Arenibaculum sp. TaxID=2865862 RepID=UPI002E0FF377|nr:chemotaxis protein CheC [Arenibaculum sp.]
MASPRPAPEFVLTEIERDALTELVNMGMGRAARNLSRMIREQVELSIPRTEILSRVGAADHLSRDGQLALVAVGQDFEGSFSGRALLLFPENNSLALARAVLDDGLSLEEIVDLEQEALAEIGNVVLNGCLVILANTLERSLNMSLPRVLRGDGRFLFLGTDGDPDELVLFLRIEFAVSSRCIEGYIALLMDLPSLSEVRQLVRDVIHDLENGPGAE